MPEADASSSPARTVSTRDRSGTPPHTPDQPPAADAPRPEPGPRAEQGAGSAAHGQSPERGPSGSGEPSEGAGSSGGAGPSEPGGPGGLEGPSEPGGPREGGPREGGGPGEDHGPEREPGAGARPEQRIADGERADPDEPATTDGLPTAPEEQEADLRPSLTPRQARRLRIVLSAAVMLAVAVALILRLGSEPSVLTVGFYGIALVLSGTAIVLSRRGRTRVATAVLGVGFAVILGGEWLLGFPGGI
ncbi:hypothetical protein [Streptomyces cacaoi]|uniref:hypothetical protein n=1 Tax=Streptomyces cacaoi TaxID=1898 RepID=UPI0037482762